MKINIQLADTTSKLRKEYYTYADAWKRMLMRQVCCTRNSIFRYKYAQSLTLMFSIKLYPLSNPPTSLVSLWKSFYLLDLDHPPALVFQPAP